MGESVSFPVGDCDAVFVGGRLVLVEVGDVGVGVPDVEDCVGAVGGAVGLTGVEDWVTEADVVLDVGVVDVSDGFEEVDDAVGLGAEVVDVELGLEEVELEVAEVGD